MDVLPEKLGFAGKVIAAEKKPKQKAATSRKGKGPADVVNRHTRRLIQSLMKVLQQDYTDKVFKGGEKGMGPWFVKSDFWNVVVERVLGLFTVHMSGDEVFLVSKA